GQSGGILLGVNAHVFDIGNIVIGDFHIKFNVRNKDDGFEWAIIAAYGAAQDDLKQSFLTEMVHFCSSTDKPFVLRGDFNININPSEKNNDRYKGDNGIIKDEVELREHITSYYRSLFGPPVDNTFTMIESRVEDIPQVYELENNILIAQFSEEEVKEAIFSMEHNKAPGLDGFPAEFYQVFWEIIKADLMAMFYDFYKGDLRLFSLNFGVITLLPKCQEAVKIQQFRPICLLNVSFKIFTKRINMVAQKVIQPSQTAFLPERYILEGVTILHETIHELHKKKLNGVIFKVDFEKAYDNVKWPFLQQTLRMKGFLPLWCQWILQFVSKGSVAVKVNNDVGRYFQTNKGLRQGDPLSPILFNLVVDMLAIFITRAKENGQVQGLLPHLVDGGLSILQYADDTILFMEHNLEQAKNMKIILCVFEKLSRLKINFHKNELFCYGEAKDFVEHYLQIFCCGVGNLLFRYLGIPMNHKNLKIGNKWKNASKKIKWLERKDFILWGRLVLINSVLSSLAMFMMSFFEVPKCILKKLDFYRSTFFRQGDSHKKKYRLVRWKILCLPKEQGGLGIRNLEIQNICLLSKWLYKLINEEGVWQNILERRALVGGRLQNWEELVSKIALVQLDDQPDSIKCNLSKHGCFTVNSMYNHLVNQTALPLNKFLWRLKLLLKIKIFVWFLFKGVILTKDNLLKRHWSGDGQCCFCDTNETIQHLFFDCHVAWFVWRVVFLAFDLRPPTNINELFFVLVIFRAIYWTRSWSALQKKGKKTAIQVGMSISGDPSYGDFCQSRVAEFAPAHLTVLNGVNFHIKRPLCPCNFAPIFAAGGGVAWPAVAPGKSLRWGREVRLPAGRGRAACLPPCHGREATLQGGGKLRRAQVVEATLSVVVGSRAACRPPCRGCRAVEGMKPRRRLPREVVPPGEGSCSVGRLAGPHRACTCTSWEGSGRGLCLGKRRKGKEATGKGTGEQRGRRPRPI
ncbi:hypothetical protein U9M48_004457, partial [Paspalum notatum var. saurae]